MIRRVSLCGMAVAPLLSCNNRAMAQSPSQVTLVIDVRKAVEYQDDIGTPSEYASKANITPALSRYSQFSSARRYGNRIPTIQLSEA